MVIWAYQWRDGVGCLAVVGEGGLVAESTLKSAVGGGGLSGSADLATPESAELGGLNGVAGRWDFEQVGA